MSITRTQVADYLATQLADGREAAITRTAAWMVRNGRTRDVSYLARDTARSALADGYLYCVVTSSQELTPTSKEQINDYLISLTQAKNLELEYRIDPVRLGGIYLDLPDTRLDATLRSRLDHFAKGLTHE